MKKLDEYLVLENHLINENHVYEMVLLGKNENLKAGQFVEVYLPGKFLGRPISIAYHTEDEIHLVYRVIGSGTEIMKSFGMGDKVRLLTGLGNGFHTDIDTKSPLLIGGGTGVAPLYDLACSLIDRGIEPRILLGFKNPKDSIYVNRFEQITYPMIAYESDEEKRYVTDYMKEFPNLGISYDYFYGCGPMPMLRAVNDIALSDGEVSLEEHMACGFGQCKCCSIETNEGMKTVCKDGPVFQKKLVKW